MDRLPDIVGLLAFGFNPGENELVSAFRASVIKLVKECGQDIWDELLSMIKLWGEEVLNSNEDSIKGSGSLLFVNSESVKTQDGFQGIITGVEDPQRFVDCVRKDQFDGFAGQSC